MIQLSKLLVVLASAESEVPIDDSSFINKLIPNWTSFVAQLAALVVMIILVIIIGYKPVKKMLKKRQDYVESSIHEAELNKAQVQHYSDCIISQRLHQKAVRQNQEMTQPDAVQERLELSRYVPPNQSHDQLHRQLHKAP